MSEYLGSWAATGVWAVWDWVWCLGSGHRSPAQVGTEGRSAGLWQAGVWGICLHLFFLLIRFGRIKLMSLCLHSKYLSKWALSSFRVFCFYFFNFYCFYHFCTHCFLFHIPESSDLYSVIFSIMSLAHSSFLDLDLNVMFLVWGGCLSGLFY